MTTRYLTVVGTASQVGTRERSPGGYALRWDDQLILFDPAEGFAHRCLAAGVSVGKTTAVCITHFHGDHCLGLPGIIQRRALSQRNTPLPVYFPADSTATFSHLMHSSLYDEGWVEPIPVSRAGVAGHLGESTLISEPLHHRVPTIGYRVQAPTRVHLEPERLAEAGLSGPAIGELVARGAVVNDAGTTVAVEDFATERAGQAMAFVMDTRLCGGAFRLSKDVDLLVAEATYLDQDRGLAERGMHMTARQAAWLARESGVGQLVLSHFSSRYAATTDFAIEATEVFPPTIIAVDASVVRIPGSGDEPSVGSAWDTVGT